MFINLQLALEREDSFTSSTGNEPDQQGIGQKLNHEILASYYYPVY